MGSRKDKEEEDEREKEREAFKVVERHTGTGKKLYR